MTTKVKAPVWYWVLVGLLVLWEAMGVYAWAMQVKDGAAAMGPVDDWSLKYYAALPAWYNWDYGVATIGGLLGGVLLGLRDRRAEWLFWLSLVAVVVMFGYAFAATDLIAHKGLAQVLPFPVFIAVVGAASVWFARLAGKRGWVG